MTSMGFIGLGIMGVPMAGNLVKSGFDVVGYNRSPHRVQAWPRPEGGALRTSRARSGTLT